MARYYIRTSGNDFSGSGTLASPWKTLKKATASVTSSGDIIDVGVGTFTETLQSTLSPGVSIEGAGVTSIITSTISAANTAIIVANSVEGTNGNQYISNIQLDGANRTTKWAIEVKGRSNFSIHDCVVVDFDQRGIMWSGRADNAPGAPGIYATGNSFYNNIVLNCASYVNPTGFGCLMIGGQDSMQIYGNTITQVGRTTGTNGWPIKYANDGYLNGCRIHHNTITKEPFDGTSWDFAYEIFNVSGLEIDHNTVIGSIDLNYQNKGSYAYSVDIHDNIIGPTTLQVQQERGIILEFDCETVLIRNNHFRNLYTPIYYSTRNNTQIPDNIISGNLFENCGLVGGGSGFGIRFISDGSNNFNLSNFKVYNNTITGNYYQAICIENAASISSVDIKNNTIQGYNHSWLFIDPANIVTTISWFNNNIYNNLSATWGTTPRYVGGSPSAETHNNNINVDPLFVGGGNYTLQSGSPLIDVGVNVGLPYTGFAPDIGYAEYISGNLTPFVNAGADQNITIPNNAILSGTAIDSDGTVVSTLWTQLSGPNTATLSSASTLTTTVSGLIVGVYIFQLQAVDNLGSVGFDTVVITVTNPAPGSFVVKRKFLF